jgi:RNA recognition motif-containing protein
MIGCKVFIGNLSEDATGENVEYLFQNFGEIVEIQLIDGFGKYMSKIIFTLVK